MVFISRLEQPYSPRYNKVHKFWIVFLSRNYSLKEKENYVSIIIDHCQRQIPCRKIMLAIAAPQQPCCLCGHPCVQRALLKQPECVVVKSSVDLLKFKTDFEAPCVKVLCNWNIVKNISNGISCWNYYKLQYMCGFVRFIVSGFKLLHLKTNMQII